MRWSSPPLTAAIVPSFAWLGCEYPPAFVTWRCALPSGFAAQTLPPFS
jgi:hypothetical protein